MNKLSALWILLLSRGWLLFSDSGSSSSHVPADLPSIDELRTACHEFEQWLDELERDMGVNP